MVSGTFKAGESPEEDDYYHRADFQAGAEGLGTREALGFLVRMRRTSGQNQSDSEPLKASHGPTIPFLWGLGSLMRQDPSTSWDPRRDGIAVRATAIAVARPALRASPAPIDGLTGQPITSESESPSPMLGLRPFALSLAFWTSINPGATWSPSVQVLTIGSGGTLTTAASVICGHAVTSNSVTSVGKPIVANATEFAALPVGVKPGYVAIYATVNGTERVVGYAFADAGRNAAGNWTVRQGIQGSAGSDTSNVKVWVAANSVSAHIGFDSPALNKADWDEVFRLNGVLVYGGSNNAPAYSVVYDHTKIRTGTLLAPALAR